MAVQEILLEWLGGFDGGVEPERSLTAQQLELMQNTYGLHDGLGRKETRFVNGDREISETVLLLARPPTGEDGTRPEAEGWLRALDKWVWARNRNGQLPAGEDGMTCLSVTMSDGRAITIADAAEPVCAIRMTMTYYEEE